MRPGISQGRHLNRASIILCHGIFEEVDRKIALAPDLATDKKILWHILSVLRDGKFIAFNNTKINVTVDHSVEKCGNLAP